MVRYYLLPNGCDQEPNDVSNGGNRSLLLLHIHFFEFKLSKWGIRFWYDFNDIVDENLNSKILYTLSTATNWSTAYPSSGCNIFTVVVICTNAYILLESRPRSFVRQMYVFESNHMLPFFHLNWCLGYNFPRYRRYQYHLELADARVNKAFTFFLFSQLLVLAVEAIVLIANLFSISYKTIDFTFFVVGEKGGRTTQRYFTNWPIWIVRQIMWKHCDL